MRGFRKVRSSRVPTELLEPRLLFAGVTLNGSSGADVIEVQKQGTDVIVKLNFVTLIDVFDDDIDQIVVNANGGADTIYLDQTGTSNTVNINGGDGADTLRLADLSGELDGNISGTINFDGGNNADSLVIDDDGSEGGKFHQFAPGGAFSTIGLFEMTYLGTEQVTLAAGSGEDFIEFTGVTFGVEVHANAGFGNDTFRVPGDELSGLDVIQGDIVLDGGPNGGAGDSLEYADTSMLAGRVYTITADTLSRNDSAAISYTSIDNIDVAAAPHTTAINVLSTSEFGNYDITGGTDAVTMWLGDAGLVEEVQGTLNLTASAGSTLVYDDVNNPFGDNYTLTGFFVSRDLSAFVLYAGFSTVDLRAGEGDSPINVFALPAAGVTSYAIDGNGGGDTLVYQGSDGDETVAFTSANLTVDGTAVVISDMENYTFDSAGGTDALTVNGVTVDALSTMKLDALSITGGGQLNLDTNDLLFDYTGSSSPLGTWNGNAYTGITGLVAAGSNAGAWNGSGLITTTDDAAAGLTTLAVGEAATVLDLAPGASATWDGITIDATTVIVKYTYGGDANLDGIVSGDDYSGIDFSILVPGSYGWASGDFNYDGVITGDDYSSIDFNILAQGEPL
jgi:hypothetical protein